MVYFAIIKIFNIHAFDSAIEPPRFILTENDLHKDINSCFFWGAVVKAKNNFQ